MLDNEKLDVVSVTNNNGERAEAIVEAAKRKINIVAEKPLSIDKAGLRRCPSRASNGTKYLARHAVEHAVFASLSGAEKNRQRRSNRGSDSDCVSEVVQAWRARAMVQKDIHVWREHYLGRHPHAGLDALDQRPRVYLCSRIRNPHGPRVSAKWKLPLPPCCNSTTAAWRHCALTTCARKRRLPMRMTVCALPGTKGIVEYQASTGVTLMTADAKPRNDHRTTASAVAVCRLPERNV